MLPSTRYEGIPAMTTLSSKRTTRYLLPFALIVFLGYLTVGIPLSVLPLYIHDDLGFGPATVGWIIAIQSLATLMTRHVAGKITDQKGAHLATLSGASICALSALFYGISTLLVPHPLLALLVLAIGRIVLGLGESLLITGALSWSVATVGAQHAGRAMVWIGIAMFGAAGAGAPIGSMLFAHGFHAVAAISLVMAILAAVLSRTQNPVPLVEGRRLPFFNVMTLVWRQGAGLALSTMGFGVMFTFLSLYFADRAWEGSQYGLTAFGIAYIGARILFGGFPDRFGGRKVAQVTLPLQVIGLVIIWLSSEPWAALVGCALLGAGYSLTFPALGVDAVRQVPSQSRGAAMGAYVAFVDIGLGLTGIIAGAVANHFGYPATFLFAAVASTAAMVIIMATKERK